MGEGNAVSVSKEEIDKLIKAHDGDVALLFMYLKVNEYDEDKAANDLCRTGKEISSAEEKLRRMGLNVSNHSEGNEQNIPALTRHGSGETRQILEPAEELPEYTSEDIVKRAKEEGCFADLITEAQRALGHTLSTPDLKILFGIYDYLGMPADVVMILINYCVEVFQQTNGSGRVSMRYIEKAAFAWARKDIMTFEKAEEYIRRDQEYRNIENLVLREIGITDRVATPTEKKYIYDWVQKGFSAEAIGIAYDRTVTATGKRTWKYMDAIILNWHQSDIHTVEEIKEKDKVRKSGATPSKSANKPVGRDGLDALKKKMNNR